MFQSLKPSSCLRMIVPQNTSKKSPAFCPLYDSISNTLQFDINMQKELFGSSLNFDKSMQINTQLQSTAEAHEVVVIRKEGIMVGICLKLL
eukprot:c5976_g1_i1 orf=1-270(-)